jgi:BirA family biotin operon repressor/biotin-[acetyl-CoA-carboxylase] ligase
VLVVAERQTAGRGRIGNDWQTAPRAVAASLGLRTSWPAEEQGLIPLLAGMAARRSIEANTGVLPGLKWPNDLVTEQGKVGGLLVEAADGDIIVGCGINLWWPQAPGGFAGVVNEDPGSEVVVSVARDWADSLTQSLSESTGRWDRAGYVAACETIGREITWEPEGKGTAVDVDDRGGLIVRSAAGRLTLRSGAVRTVRDATLAGDSSDEGGAP